MELTAARPVKRQKQSSVILEKVVAETKMVTLTYAQSIDGSICRERGKPVAISSKESFEFTHCLRANHDAIVVGVGTMMADNPSLTTRLVEGQDPTPVIIDSNVRTPASCKLFNDPRCKKKPVIICTKDGLSQNQAAADILKSHGARIVAVKSDHQGHVNMVDAIESLQKDFDKIMIEGGASIITSLLSNEKTAMKLTRVILTIAPVFFGGLCSIQQTIPESEVKWKVEDCEVVGGDIIAALVISG